MICLLTEYLLHISSSAFQPQLPTTFCSATQTPFLRLAGQGKISKSLLSRWLVQDKLYALAYVRFVAGLLSKIHLESSPNFDPVSKDHESNSHELGRGNDQTLLWRLSTCLIGALQNIHREIEFFGDVARRYGLQLEANDKAPNTEAYIALFDRMTTNKTLLEGLIVLWATEKCYYEAWKYAASFLNTSRQGQQGEIGMEDMDGGALRTEFIPNWTNEAFGKFVGELGDLLDNFAIKDIEKVGKKACEEVWNEVLRLEKGFWPALPEEGRHM